MVSLFGSSRSTETLKRRGVAVRVRQSSSKLYMRKLKWQGCIIKYVFISVLHLLTLSGRFRVGFGVGNDRALAFRDRPWIFELAT